MFCNFRAIEIKNLQMQAPSPQVRRKSLVSGMSARTLAVELQPKRLKPESPNAGTGWLQGLRTLLGFGQ